MIPTYCVQVRCQAFGHQLDASIPLITSPTVSMGSREGRGGEPTDDTTDSVGISVTTHTQVLLRFVFLSNEFFSSVIINSNK